MTSNCIFCGRELTSETSVARGIGPQCAKLSKPIHRQSDMFSESDYEYMMIEGVLVIIDLDLGGKSVTNNISTILKEIGQAINLECVPIMYRDSMSYYTGINHQGDRFDRFIQMSERDQATALERMKRLSKEH